MIDKLDAEFQFGKSALDLRAYRQQLLSSNIANADTPGYKARDVDFASSLKAALGQGQATGGTGSTGAGAGAGAAPPLALTTTTADQLPGTAASDSDVAMFGAPLYRNPTQASLDNNTVDIDTERVNFADNTVHYETGLTVLSQQIKTMLAALSDGS